MDAYRTVVSYLDSDNTTTVDFGTLGTVIDWSVEHKNNIKTNKRRIGDTVQTPGVGRCRCYVRRMPRGKYETTISMLIDFLNLSYWTKSTSTRS
jgi:hypothetical protein